MAKKKPKGELPLGSGPGVGALSIPAVDTAAKEYNRVKEQRVALTRREVDAKQKLIDLLHKNESRIGRDGAHVLRYRYEGKVIVLEPEGEKLRIMPAGEEE